MEAYNVFYGIALHQPGRRIPNAVFGFIGQSPRPTDVVGILEYRLRSGKFRYFAVSAPISTGPPTDLRPLEMGLPSKTAWRYRKIPKLISASDATVSPSAVRQV
jgi:hypothetical protein